VHLLLAVNAPASAVDGASSPLMSLVSGSYKVPRVEISAQGPHLSTAHGHQPGGTVHGGVFYLVPHDHKSVRPPLSHAGSGSPG
jgi:hypothetical protein